MLARSVAGKAFNRDLVSGTERQLHAWAFPVFLGVPGHFPRNPSTKSIKRRRYVTARQSSLDHPSDTGLRHRPWNFTSDSTPNFLSFSVSQYNLQLSKYAESGNVLMTLDICREMKELGVMPTLTIYNWIIQAFSVALRPLEARAVVDDMLALGIKPDRTSMHFLLKAHEYESVDCLLALLDWMSKWKITPSAATYAPIIDFFLVREHFEMALQVFTEMQSRKITPNLEISQRMIVSAARHYPRLAVDWAISFEEKSVRRLDGLAWQSCLASTAEILYMDGVITCWNALVHSLKILPDEGTCINVLHTAARHGLPDLAAQVLEVLKTIGTKFYEFHFAPVIEAFCKANKMKEAFQLLHLMRMYNITPLPSTSFPLFESIRQNVDRIDETYALVKQMKDDGEPIDVSVLEVFLQAAIYQGDLQRSLEIYESYPKFDIVPTINTLNLLLAGCVAARHRALGDKLLDEITKQRSIKPDLHTYEQMILLCLTQDTYEDAFFYLEEMKGAGFFPTLKIYEELVRKCVDTDDPRYKIALDELRECHYPISENLKQVLAQTNLRGPKTSVQSKHSPKGQ